MKNNSPAVKNMTSIGVYIDADNVSAEMANTAIQLIKAQYGKVHFLHAFGNWSCKPLIWKRVCNKHGVTINHRYNHTKSKNASDIALVVEATAALYRQSFETIVVVSSDSDFLPLIQHAHSCGKKAIGFGERKTSHVYSGLCDEFHFFEDLTLETIH